MLFIFLNERPAKAIIRLEIVEGKSVAIWHPRLVDIVVLARCHPENFVAPGPDHGISTSSAVHIDAFRFFKKPNTHLKPEVVRGESSNWTNISSIKGVVVIKPITWMNSDLGMGSSLRKS